MNRAVALACAAMLLLAQAAVVAIWPDAHLLMIDLQVYRAGGEAVVAGTPLYAGGVLLDLPFVYPPFAALLFAPLTVLPLPLLKLLWTLAGIALVVFVVRRSAALLGWDPGAAGTALLVAVALALDPVRTTFYLGQINVVLLALVLADVTGRPDSRRPETAGLASPSASSVRPRFQPPVRWRGVGVGLAAALKLTPLIFVAYLLLTGRRRAAAVAVGTFAAAVGVGFLVDPRDSTEYWLRGTFAAADRISPVAALSNHSLAGLLARAGTPPGVAIAALAVLAAAGLAVAVLAHRRGHELLAVTLCGLLAAAAAPFAWSHHYVWFVPLLVLLARCAVGAVAAGWPCSDRTGAGPPCCDPRRARLALAVLLVGTLAVVTRLPGPGVGPIPSTGLISLVPDAYLVLAVAALAVAAWETTKGSVPRGARAPTP